MSDQTSERFFISDRKLGLAPEEPAADPVPDAGPGTVSKFASGALLPFFSLFLFHETED